MMDFRLRGSNREFYVDGNPMPNSPVLQGRVSVN